MTEKWKKAVDNGNVFGAILTDLSRASDCLPHDLIFAKLNSYGLDLTALNLIHSYFAKRKQKTKINQSNSSWEDILFGVAQGPILGPILFNIFLSDLFLTCEKLLGIKIDSKLHFDDHIQDLRNKANRKLRALARTNPYINLQKRKVLLNAFFNAQFNYCPLIWMLHSRRNNNKIKHSHERCLRLVHDDKLSFYEELLEKDGSVSIHHKNIQGLAIEMFQINMDNLLKLLAIFLREQHSITISDKIEILGYAL